MIVINNNIKLKATVSGVITTPLEFYIVTSNINNGCGNSNDSLEGTIPNNSQTVISPTVNQSTTVESFTIFNADNVSHNIEIQIGDTVLGIFTLSVNQTLLYANEVFSYDPPDTNVNITNIIGGVAISAGTEVQTSGTASFANSNGVSFGMNSGTITASVIGGAASINISAGTASNNLTNLVFSNSNGISFGLNGSTLTGSYNSAQFRLTANDSQLRFTSADSQLQFTSANSNFRFTSADSQLQFTSAMSNYQTTGNYLTTAMQSNAGSNFLQASAVFNGTNASGTIASNGISVSVAAPITTSGLISAIKVSAGTLSQNLTDITFQNSNGISFGLSGSTLTATVKTDYQSSGNYLTTAMQSNAGSNFVQATALFNGTNASGTIASNGISISVAPPITTSGLISAINISAGTTSNNLTALTYNNSNGISFGLNGSTITASHNGLTSQSVQQASLYASNNTTVSSSGTADLNSLAFRGGGYVSVGIANNTIQISHNAQHWHINTIDVANNLSWSNSNNVTFGYDTALSLATASASFLQSTQPVAASASNGSYNFSTLKFVEGSGVTWATQAGGIQASVKTDYQSSGAYLTTAMQSNAATISNIKLSAGTSSTNLSAITFSDAGNVSFGLNGSVITASAPTSPLNFSAGTTSNNLDSIVFSNSNNVSFGLNGSTITGSIPQSITYEGYNPLNPMISAFVGQGVSTLHIQPMYNVPNIKFDRVVLGVQYSNASNSSNSCTVSVSVGIFTKNVSSLSLITSASTSWNVTNSGTVGSYSLYAGIRHFSIGLTTTLTENNYYMGVWSATATGGGAGMTYNMVCVSQLNSNYSGQVGVPVAGSISPEIGYGIYSAATNAMPSAISLTQIIGTASVNLRPPYYRFESGTL